MIMKKVLTITLMILIIVSSGCAYRHYLGMHGPSIRNLADTHKGVTEDSQCLECHNPDDPTDAPPTNHPGFKGCLKCHNGA